MNVVFRVDASLQMGIGHVMRCLVLAQALKENGAKVEFICRNYKGNLINKISSYKFLVHKLEFFSAEDSDDDNLTDSYWLGVSEEQDLEDCINVIKERRIDWLIVDHYLLGEKWQKGLKPYYKKLLVIDDLADRRHYCDVLLDQTFGRKQDDYSAYTPKDCLLLLGSKYSLLRPEFHKWRSYSLKRRNQPEFRQLLISMGGTDFKNVTENILDELKFCNLPKDINITVIMGESAPNLESVKSKIHALPFKSNIKVDVDNLAEIMANADIAIGAAGSTSWERCCLGLPTIQIVLAKNQINIAESLAKINAIRLLQDVKDLPRTISDARNWMIDVSNISRKVSDGLGINRVMSIIMDLKL